MSKILTMLTIVPLLVPLFIYPFVLMANFMMMGGADMDDVSVFTRIVVSTFVWSTSLYPIVIGVLLYRWKRANGSDARKKYLRHGYGYLFICCILFVIWSYV